MFCYRFQLYLAWAPLGVQESKSTDTRISLSLALNIKFAIRTKSREWGWNFWDLQSQWPTVAIFDQSSHNCQEK